MINSKLFLILAQTYVRKVTKIMTSSQKGKNWTIVIGAYNSILKDKFYKTSLEARIQD
jgi:hypothetical protein